LALVDRGIDHLKQADRYSSSFALEKFNLANDIPTQSNQPDALLLEKGESLAAVL
jgi:hypothetical protein